MYDQGEREVNMWFDLHVDQYCPVHISRRWHWVVGAVNRVIRLKDIRIHISDVQTAQGHNEEVPQDCGPTNKLGVPSEVIGAWLIIRVVFIHAPSKDRQNIRDLSGKSTSREECFESGIGANRNGSKRSRGNKYN